MIRLWEVRIERIIMVIAESEDQAESVALKYEQENIRDGDPDYIHAMDIRSKEQIPDGWEDAIPYGDQLPTLTCGQIFEGQP